MRAADSPDHAPAGALRRAGLSGAGRGRGVKRRVPGVARCWKSSTTAWTSPSWTPPLPATCRMCWKCPTGPPLAGRRASRGKRPYTYRLAGPTCLAGDVIGDYSFDQPLTEGSQVVLEDMALYTMVKTNTFNGMPLPQPSPCAARTGRWSWFAPLGMRTLKPGFLKRPVPLGKGPCLYKRRK